MDGELATESLKKKYSKELFLTFFAQRFLLVDGGLATENLKKNSQRNHFQHFLLVDGRLATESLKKNILSQTVFNVFLLNVFARGR